MSGSPIRLYGLTVGNGSIARVTAGMAEGLTACGRLAGLVPCDAFDEDEVYGGHDAPAAMLAGGNYLHAAKNYGWHKKLYVLVPPNSTWVPEHPLRTLHKSGCTIVSPSHWGADMIRARLAKHGLPMPVSVWQHGVSAAFAPSEGHYRDRLAEYRRGVFACLHLASEFVGRKGTEELVQAWLCAVDAGQLGSDPRLLLVVDGPRSTFDGWLAASGASRRAKDTIEWAHRRLDFGLDKAAATYQSFHALVQPSRGEGWGLTPMESLASGVPIVATACTGHADYLPLPGATVVEHGPYADVGDGPDGQAPTVSVEAVQEALATTYARWPEQALAAMNGAAAVGREWSWERVTRRWLAQEDL